jgi:DNA-binding NarL/FixJ family response regulator
MKAHASPEVRILVVDDYEPFRRLVCKMLHDQPRLRVIEEIQDGLEVVKKAETLQPDLILLDIGLPGISGIEAARRIGKRAPNIKIIFLTQETSPDLVHEALKLGLGYVAKAKATNELLLAVETVLQGKQFIGSGLDGRG